MYGGPEALFELTSARGRKEALESSCGNQVSNMTLAILAETTPPQSLVLKLVAAQVQVKS